MLREALSLAEPTLAAASPEAASRAFGAAARRLGASFIQTRSYRRPPRRLTSASHWNAGGVILRDAVPGWVGSAGFDYICFEQNPLLAPIRQGLTRYRFSDFAPFADRRFGAYWDALGSAKIADAICATAYGDGRRIASVHIGVPQREVDRDVCDTLSLAGGILVEKLLTFAPSTPSPVAIALTARERDALGFVADGKTDWEIARILGIAETTARFHVDNARRKLGAVNRSHAVARLIAEYGPL